MDSPTSLYDVVGGSGFFERLVQTFYAGVATDDVLAPLYPEAPDFRGATHRLTMFLIQYWGGPADYQAERGHPRLRLRHMPFTVGVTERDHWLAHMTHAVESTTQEMVADGQLDDDRAEQIASQLLNYFVPSAEHLRNDTGLPITSSTFGR